jgi:DNA-binding transcriptional ArsR family regulator
MSGTAMALVAEPERLRQALSPLRRQLLDHLRSPASATQLAATLGLSRQRVNYHLRALEDAGLIELVAQRQRRGCVERILRTTAEAFVVDPSVMAADETVAFTSAAFTSAAFTSIADRYASEHLVGVAAGTVRDVARMQTSAEREGTRLLTFTVEAEIRFATPGDLHDFTDELTAAVAATVERFDSRGGRPYRLILGGHPAPRPQGGASE